MPASQLLMPLLGAIIGQQAPEQNPDAWTTDEYGNRVLKPGATPFKPAGFGTKWLHPEVAAQIGMLNNEDYQAAMSNAIRNRIMRENIQSARRGFGKDVTEMNPQELAQMTQGNAANIPGVQAASLEQKEGVPALTAQELALKRREGIRSTRALMGANIPELGASAEASRLGFVPKQIGAAETLLQPQTETELGELGARKLLSQVSSNQSQNMIDAADQLKKKFGFDIGRDVFQSEAERNLARQQLENSPLNEKILRNQAIAGAMNSNRLPPVGYPYSSLITPEGNVEDLSRDPRFVSEMAMKMAGMTGGTPGGTLTGPNGKPVLQPNGQPIELPKKEYSPLTGRELKLTRPPIAPVNINPQAQQGPQTAKDVENSWDKANQQMKLNAVQKIERGIKLTPYERSLFTNEEWRQIMGIKQ